MIPEVELSKRALSSNEYNLVVIFSSILLIFVLACAIYIGFKRRACKNEPSTPREAFPSGSFSWNNMSNIKDMQISDAHGKSSMGVNRI